MGERGGKTISMNDEIPPVYTVSKGSQRTRLTEVDLQFLQVKLWHRELNFFHT